MQGDQIREEDDHRQELMEAFPGMDCYMAPLSLSVACHIGPDVFAAAITKRLEP